jgi:hypothetical protein
MKTIFSAILVAGVLTSMVAPAGPVPLQPSQTSVEETLNNAGIVEMKQLGLGESVITEKIKSSRCSFDVSLSGLKQLKAAEIPDTVISAMLSANSVRRETATTDGPRPTDLNDPAAHHDAGIWLYEEAGGKPKMTQLEPSVYSQRKTTVVFFAEFGQTAKSKAVIHNAHAELVTTNNQPTFYFYFEHLQSGLSDPQGPTSANEYILSQFEVNDKDNERRLVTGSQGIYEEGKTGVDGKSVRSFNFQKIGPGVYKVTPKINLTDGEYGFFYGGNSNGGKVFDFGVRNSAEAPLHGEVTETAQNVSKPHGLKALFHKKHE